MKKNIKFSNPKKIFYATIIGFAVICFWRGVWGLLDIYLFPNQYALSLWISTLLGIVILISTHHLVKELM